MKRKSRPRDHPVQSAKNCGNEVTALLNIASQMDNRVNQMPYGRDNTQVQQLPTRVSGYPSKLIGRTGVAKGTMAFHFERPRNFVFRAGQSLDLSLFGWQRSLHRDSHILSRLP